MLTLSWSFIFLEMNALGNYMNFSKSFLTNRVDLGFEFYVMCVPSFQLLSVIIRSN